MNKPLKIIGFVIILFIAEINGYCQSSKDTSAVVIKASEYNSNEQTVEKKVKNKDLKLTELFHVLKNDKSMKHGKYEKYVDIPQTKKYFLIESGQFDHNKKVGVWTYFNDKKQVSLQYDFDHDSIIMFNNLNMADGSKENRPLLYLGSSFEIKHISSWAPRVPMAAHKFGQSGKVIVEIHISEKGEADNYTIKQSVNRVLDDEALRVAKLIPNSWLPIIRDGQRCSSSYELPINFIIMKGTIIQNY